MQSQLKYYNIYILVVLFFGGCFCTPVVNPQGELLDYTLIRDKRITDISLVSGRFQQQNPFFFQLDEVEALKTDYYENHSFAIRVVNDLKKHADSILSIHPPSVVHKPNYGLSKDEHDYVSIGTYWWPNPDSQNGLPYIRRDGYRNPEVDKYDRTELGDFTRYLKTLSLAYYVTGDHQYFEKAVQLLQVWFVDSQTKMNPNLKYAQGIPGVTSGRAAGIIEGRNFVIILDSILLLREANEWDKLLELKLFLWYESYFNWLSRSNQAQNASLFTNNHGSWYDVQMTAYSVALGDTSLAIDILHRVVDDRILVQIENSGIQPKESKRGKGLHYSTLNLEALTTLAVLGNHFDINIWGYPTTDRSTLVSAIEYLLPYVRNTESWPFDQSEDYNKCSFIPILKSAYDFTGDIDYTTYIREISEEVDCARYSFLN